MEIANYNMTKKHIVYEHPSHSNCGEVVPKEHLRGYLKLFVCRASLSSKQRLKKSMTLCSCCTLRYISDYIQHFSFIHLLSVLMHFIFICTHCVAAEADYRQCCIVGWRAWQFPQQVSSYVKLHSFSDETLFSRLWLEYKVIVTFIVSHQGL